MARQGEEDVYKGKAKKSLLFTHQAVRTHK